MGDDPILLVSKMFRACDNPNKVDLGVGVYKDAEGHTAILNSVKKAEQYLVENQETKTYLSPAGNPDFNSLLHCSILPIRPLCSSNHFIGSISALFVPIT